MRLALPLLILIFHNFAYAEFFVGPAAASMAGAGRAGLTGPESAFLNPALVPLIQSTEILGYFRDGQAGPGAHRNAWGVGAVDSTEDAYFPAAAHYLRMNDTGRAATSAKGELYHVAVGKNISQRLAVGASGYMLKYSVFGDRSYTQFNGSAGLLVLVTDTMGFAYVLNNVAKPGSEVPTGLREDMNQGIGVYGAIAEIARMRFDVTRAERYNPDKKMAYMVGLESMVNEYVVFRMGFKRDELADQSVYGAGFGFNGPRLKVDYAFEKAAKGTQGAVHSVDMRIPF